MRSHRDISGRSFYGGLLEALIQVMGNWNGYLYLHGPRVACIALRLARSFGLPVEEKAKIFFGSVLADVGMIGMVEDAWEDPRPTLSEAARIEVKAHPSRSAESVESIPYLTPVAELVRAHHEWWNGSGYPAGLEGEDIPMGARILRLSDTVAALGEVRPHRPALSSTEIRKTVLDLSGVEFCPEVAKRFVSLLDRGDIQGFNEQSFRSSLLQAVDFFVPAEVSRVSARELLNLFAGLVDAKDPYTGGHSRRVALLARAVSERMDLPEDVRERSWAAGFLHDMGKVCVPLRVLTKPGKLAPEEFRSVQNHTVVGARIARSIPSLQHLSPSCRYHHERWDGTGYPEGISGPRIPLMAQVLAVADSYDAMTSGRAYRASRSHGHAMEEVDRCAGTHFSPRVTGAFLTLPYETFWEIQQVDYPLPHRFSVPYQEQFRLRQQALLAAE